MLPGDLVGDPDPSSVHPLSLSITPGERSTQHLNQREVGIVVGTCIDFDGAELVYVMNIRGGCGKIQARWLSLIQSANTT